LLDALDARIIDRLYGMQRLLDEREAKEIADITAILTELKQSIERELDDIAKPVQLELFNNSELEQLTRNVDALRRRLRQIPDEIDAESESIANRFANPQPRMFPVDVTFVVPEKFD
jgi:hypothetical protein